MRPRAPGVGDDVSPLPPVLGGVLVGGRSTRMGRPKQLLQIQGQTLVERVVQAIFPVVQGLVLIGAGATPPALALPRLRDVDDVQGPLAGILAALRSAPHAAWLIAACDLPGLTTEAVRWLLAQRAPGDLVLLPSLDGEQVEPLLALYEPAALPALERLVAQGRRAPRWLRDQPGCHVVRVPAELQPAWTNVNLPDDLQRLPR